MNVHDWSLIAFTILAQMSVGAFVILGIVHAVALRQAGEAEASRLSNRALLAIGPVLILGMLASFFHLGNPVNAYLAMANLGSSWLSLEIFFGVIFVILGGIFAIMQWRNMASFAVRNVIAWLAALVGLGLVYAMARVYMLEAQPAWNTPVTLISFYTTTFLLGGLAIGAAFVANYTILRNKADVNLEVQAQLLRDSLRWIAMLSIVLLGVVLVVMPLYVASLSAGGPVAQASANLLVEEYGFLFGLRLALVFIGAGLFALFLYRNAMTPGREQLLGNLAYAAFALVFVAEVMGRYLFYATIMAVGI
jgi:anaerobic dimethyl sulfoxide reductase subunit C